MKNTFLSLCVTCIAFIALPASSEAYYTTNQGAHAVSDNTAFYGINYTFSAGRHDRYLPIITKRNQERNLSVHKIGYTFTTSEGGDVSAGTSNGFVFSSAPIEDGKYKIAAGTRQNFLLFVALTLSEDDPRAKYGLQVTNLPFLNKVDGVYQEAGLNVSELTAYHTKEVGLNR